MLRLFKKNNLAPLKLVNDPACFEILLREPLLFAAHYAILLENNARPDWPEDIQQKINVIIERYEAHDAVLELMERFRGEIPTAISVSLARGLAEGMEIHPLLHSHRDLYREHCNQIFPYQESDFEEIANLLGDASPLGRLKSLSRLLELHSSEAKLLSYCFVLSVDPVLGLFTELFCKLRTSKVIFWQSLLDLDQTATTCVFGSQSKLISSGLIETKRQHPVLAEFWRDHLLKITDSFEIGLLEPLDTTTSAGSVGRLPEEDREILQALLEKKDRGINILLYGKSGLDKLRLACHLVDELGAKAYTLSNLIPSTELSAALKICQQIMARMDGSPVLVVDHAHRLLSGTHFREYRLFGLDEDEEDSKSVDKLLTDNPIPTLWLSNDPQRMHRETLSRFLFHAEIRKATRADREAVVHAMIDELPLTAEEKTELAGLEGLSISQLASARKLAQITSKNQSERFSKHFRVATQRSQKALANGGKDGARIPVTRYSLEYLNTAGKFGPEQILKALSHRPQGSICLYGLPGTGKTQFAEYVAQQLGKPLLICRASELLDKYIGESEKRVAEIFTRAEEEEAMLLLDEADSFLRDRNLSKYSWEVTLVNELLQRMERFDDILICTTNLYRQLDMAALRRFTFKMEFLPLSESQRLAMFLGETGLDRESMEETVFQDYGDTLSLMRDLTPGDFATVKRQCLLLGETLEPEAWLQQLEMEARARQGRELNE
jgi:AAA+ superfamily predicted ATPase